MHPLMVLGHASHQNYALAHELNSKLPFAMEFVIPVNQNGIYNNSYDRIILFYMFKGFSLFKNITCELFKLMNNALKLYAFLSDLIRTRCWQIPPTPSGFGLPRHERPKTRSSNIRFVNKTPKQNPSKLYLR